MYVTNLLLKHKITLPGKSTDVGDDDGDDDRYQELTIIVPMRSRKLHKVDR